MSIKNKIENDLKAALKKKKEVEVSTLRMLLAAIKNFEIQRQSELSDEEVVTVVQKQIKQRKESIEAFQKGKRDDLVAKEREELEILSKYLPQQLTNDELEKIVKETVEELKAGQKDFGMVMGKVMEKIRGKAEGSLVAEIVRKNLTSVH